MSRIVVAIQGVYYAITGIWPLVSFATFQMVTGPKFEVWLVHTVGLLALAIGIALVAGAYRRYASPETVVLSIGAAFAFGLIDVFYYLNGTIGPVYLADAVVEGLFIVCLLGAWAFETTRR